MIVFVSAVMSACSNTSQTQDASNPVVSLNSQNFNQGGFGIRKSKSGYQMSLSVGTPLDGSQLTSPNGYGLNLNVLNSDQ
jgi:hypothetical protein